MVNDMYAIYESYITKETVATDPSRNTLSGTPRLPASITNTAGRSNILATGQGPTTDQGISRGDLGQDNQEVKVPKEILKVIDSLVKSTHKADWRSQMLIDCMQLRKLLENTKK